MKRIEYLDAIKGIAIILMVIGHAIAWNYGDFKDIVEYNAAQPVNVKVGGGNLAINLFFPHGSFLYGVRIPLIQRIGC